MNIDTMKTEPAPAGLNIVDAPEASPVPSLRTGSAPSSLRDVLQKRIDEGTNRALGMLRTVAEDVPADSIAKATALVFEPSNGRLVVGVGDRQLSPTSWALGQLAERASVPATYLRGLLDGDPAEVEIVGWRADLATEILRRHYAHDAGRVLVRSVRGSMRGLLSDRYRRLDSRPLVDAMVAEAQHAGAVPCDGTATETRCAIKVIIPEILEPIPGEYVVVGAEWSNSDYGNGVHSVRAFALRAVCLNGMTRENILRQVHLGGRLGEDAILSDRTYRLDTAASVSAMRDIIRGTLGAAGREKMIEAIRESNAKPFTEAQLVRTIRNAAKPDQKLIVDAYKSEDVINLPAGETAWRASNAISWVARHVQDAERRLDLERLAGSVV